MRGRVGPTVSSPHLLVGLEAEAPHTLASSWVPVPTELLQTNSATAFCTMYFITTTKSVRNLTPYRLADSVKLSEQHTASILKTASPPWRLQQYLLTKHLPSTDSVTHQFTPNETLCFAASVSGQASNTSGCLWGGGLYVATPRATLQPLWRCL
jgi:hypothetical protein